MADEAAPTTPAAAPVVAPVAVTVPTAAPEEKQGKKPVFFIDVRPKLIKLPEFKDKTKINVRYPLLPPYAFAHVFWDVEHQELLYDVEEPVLTPTEQEVLKLIQLGLEEMINVSYVRAAKMKVLIDYLEKNVQSIIV